MGNRNQKLALLLVISLACVLLIAVLGDLFFAAGGGAPVSCSITISEICSRNTSVIADSDGKYRDYIELYNAGDTVDLKGFRLTDGRGTSEPFPSIRLEAGEYRVFFLGKDVTGFGLSASGGDSIQLLDPAGNVVAQASTTTLGEDQVMVFSAGGYITSGQPSPGFANSFAGIRAFQSGTESQELPLVISEVLVSNTSALADTNGFFHDVVEIHNRSDEPVYLGGYFLSDDPSARFAMRLPDQMLEAGGYLAIHCSGTCVRDAYGEIHAGFKLRQGETLFLTHRSGNYSALPVEYAGKDVSIALAGDGSYISMDPSPGYPNTEEGAELFALSRINTRSALIVSEVVLTDSGIPWDGQLCDAVEIQNCSSGTVSTEGWFLSDGGDPYAYPLPAQTLLPGECLVIPCSYETTGFALSAGETVRLMGPDFLYAQPVLCALPPLGQSISITGDSCSFADATLGYDNASDPATSEQVSGGLIFSELMSANRSYLVGPYATTCDWVEVYNASDKTILLSEYTLTKDPGKKEFYSLPDTRLEPGKYCVIFLSKDETNLLKGYPVVPLTLSSQGDALYLARDGVITDYAVLPELGTDRSFGRPNGSFKMSVLSNVTPGSPNGGSITLSAMPTAITAQGVYDNVSYVDVELSGPGELYYSTNCYDPGTNARRYTGPIRLWETTVLKVICREPGKADSEVLTLSYIINEHDTLSVVSIVTNPDDLWSEESGIYVPGPGYTEEPPHYGANYWMPWEKAANLSLFEPDGSGFSANCGLKIFGAYTRSLPKKSLACMFRDSYGQGELAYPLFGEDSLDTYESIVIRSAGQDSTFARMRDVLCTSLVADTLENVPVQDYKPVVVYLNGEYWGLHYIREKLNENYVAGHYNVSADTVLFDEYAGWECAEYRALIKYVMTNDMSDPACYEYVCSQMDVDNFIDYFIVQLWTANTDTGNAKFFRIGDDGKWTWCVFDLDLSFSKYRDNTIFSGFHNQDLQNPRFTTKPFAVRLMLNETFREKFMTRMAWQMNNLWTEENIIARIDELEAAIEEDMVKDCQRWECSYEEWRGHVESLRSFARNRSQYVITFMKSMFNLTDEQMIAYGFKI